MMNRHEELAVMEVPEPQWTDSWHPISHARCINTLQNVFDQMNLPVVSKDYSLSKDGSNVFASWVLDKRETDGLAPSIIWRNSVSKSFAFGLAGGTHTFICSNMAFIGDSFVEFRKHTNGMDDDELYRVVNDGVGKILPITESFTQWHLGLHEIPLTDRGVKQLAYEAIVEEVVSRKKIGVFNEMLFGEEPSYNRNELHGFHGACTELIRDMNMTNSAGKQAKLYNFIDERYGKNLPVVQTAQ